jgi:excisionase family DNA binding protein
MSKNLDQISYRIPQAVTATGLKRSKLYELIKEGRLRTVKVGGCTLIPRQDLEALVAPPKAA